LNRLQGEHHLKFSARVCCGGVGRPRQDLPTNKLGVDVDNGFSPEYVISRGKKKILDQIKKDAKASDEVFLALDLDREGEAIAWHIRDYIAPVQKNVKRIIFNEITKTAIRAPSTRRPMST
jgi:DNA topoisomerase-1